MSFFVKFLIAVVAVTFGSANFCRAADQAEADCPTIDLSARTGRIESQGSTGWCYAFASATLATFATGNEISAGDIAINYNSEVKNPTSRLHQSVADDYRGANPGCFESTIAKNINDIDGGYPDLAFNETMRVGFCKLKDLPDEVKTREGDYWSGRERILEMEHALATIDPSYRCRETTFLRSAFPTSDLRKLAEAIKDATVAETVKAADGFACKARVQSSYVAQKVSFARNDPQSTAFLMAEIRSMRPIAVSLNVMELMHPQKQIRARLANEARRDTPCFRESNLDVAGHAISVIGQRYNRSRARCEVMVKNSWGVKPNCSDYDTSIVSCDDRGYAYVPFDAIQKNLYALTVLRPANSK